MRRSSLIVAVVLVGGACSSDAGTPRSTEAFCNRLAGLRATNPLEDAASSEAAADEVTTILDDLIDTSPQQIKEDLRRFRDVVDDLRDVDASDPEAAEEAIRSLATAEVLSSAQSLATFAREQCGFDDVFQAEGT